MESNPGDNTVIQDDVRFKGAIESEKHTTKEQISQKHTAKKQITEKQVDAGAVVTHSGGDREFLDESDYDDINALVQDALATYGPEMIDIDVSPGLYYVSNTLSIDGIEQNDVRIDLTGCRLLPTTDLSGLPVIEIVSAYKSVKITGGRIEGNSDAPPSVGILFARGNNNCGANTVQGLTVRGPFESAAQAVLGAEEIQTVSCRMENTSNSGWAVINDNSNKAGITTANGETIDTTVTTTRNNWYGGSARVLNGSPDGAVYIGDATANTSFKDTYLSNAGYNSSGTHVTVDLSNGNTSRIVLDNIRCEGDPGTASVHIRNDTTTGHVLYGLSIRSGVYSSSAQSILSDANTTILQSNLGHSDRFGAAGNAVFNGGVQDSDINAQTQTVTFNGGNTNNITRS